MSATSCHCSQIRTSTKPNPEILECEQFSQHWIGFCHPCHCHNNVLSLPQLRYKNKMQQNQPWDTRIWADMGSLTWMWCKKLYHLNLSQLTLKHPQITGHDSWEAVTWRIYPVHCTGHNSEASIKLDLLTSLKYIFMIHPHISIISPQILHKPIMCSNHQQPSDGLYQLKWANWSTQFNVRNVMGT